MGFESSESAIALVGMDGFRLLTAAEVDGELHQLVETTAGVVGCRGCGTRALSKGRRDVRVRDLPAGGRRVVVVWHKRIWRCPDADCEVGTWTERTEAIAPRASMTERARAEACRQVGQNRSVACVARDLGVGWATIMAAVEDHGRPLVEDPHRTAATSALGLDEIAFLRANAHRHTTFATNFVDLDRGRLLDVIPGRSAKAVHDWLATRSSQWRTGVRTVAIDPFRGYANGVAVHLGRATVVVDPFHVIALANRAIDDVRRRLQNDTLGHRGVRVTRCTRSAVCCCEESNGTPSAPVPDLMPASPPATRATSCSTRCWQRNPCGRCTRRRRGTRRVVASTPS